MNTIVINCNIKCRILCGFPCACVCMFICIWAHLCIQSISLHIWQSEVAVGYLCWLFSPYIVRSKMSHLKTELAYSDKLASQLVPRIPSLCFLNSSITCRLWCLLDFSSVLLHSGSSPNAFEANALLIFPSNKGFM